MKALLILAVFSIASQTVAFAEVSQQHKLGFAAKADDDAQWEKSRCSMYTNAGLGYEAKQKCESEKVRCVKVMADSKYKNEQDPTVLWNKDNWECKDSYRYILDYAQTVENCPTVNDVFAACLADLKQLSELPQE